MKRTQKLSESENRNKGKHFQYFKRSFDFFACFPHFNILHLVFIPVETAQIREKSAVINDRLEEHNKACSELKRLQV